MNTYRMRKYLETLEKYGSIEVKLGFTCVFLGVCSVPYFEHNFSFWIGWAESVFIMITGAIAICAGRQVSRLPTCLLQAHFVMSAIACVGELGSMVFAFYTLVRLEVPGGYKPVVVATILVNFVNVFLLSISANLCRLLTCSCRKRRTIPKVSQVLYLATEGSSSESHVLLVEEYPETTLRTTSVDRQLQRYEASSTTSEKPKSRSIKYIFDFRK